MPGNPFEKKWGTLAKIFMVSATMTHEGWRYTPFTLEIHVDHDFFEDTKVLFQSILHRCGMYFFDPDPECGAKARRGAVWNQNGKTGYKYRVHCTKLFNLCRR